MQQQLRTETVQLQFKTFGMASYLRLTVRALFSYLMSFSYLTIGVGQGDEIPLGGPRHIQDGIRELFLPNLPKGTHCNPKSEKGQIA